MSPKSRKNIKYDRDLDKVPDFNVGTVQSLAQKIQDSFKNPANKPLKSAATESKKGKNSKKAGINGQAANQEDRSTSVANEKRDAKESQPNSSALGGVKQTQGKKRLRNGQVKTPRKDGMLETTSANDYNTKTKLTDQSARSEDLLAEEVFGLGGTKDDLELLKDAASESEFDGDNELSGKSLDGGLKGELLQMVQGLGIESAGHDLLELETHTDDGEDGTIPQDLANEQRKDIVKDKRNATVVNGIRDHPRSEDRNIQSTIQAPVSQARGKARLLLEPQSEWHSVEIPSIDQSELRPRAVPFDLLDRVHKHAKALLEKENIEYAAHYGSASTERKFYSTLMTAGTLSDKISALTLSVQESPLHNMKALESLLGLARKRSRDQAVNVLGALKDLFGTGNLLPSDRRLRNFESQPALLAAFSSNSSHHWIPSSRLPGSLREFHLIIFAYEDWLKSIFFEMLQILEIWCNDEVIYARGKAVEYIAALLRDKPEQEANLLRLIVNKLGDSNRKVASKASFNILQLETSHPLMKPTIVAAIESDSLFRPNQSLHAQYYAIITLNQTVLSAKEEALARKLLDIYFDLFAKLLKRPDAALQEKDASASGANKIAINKKGQIQGGGGVAGKKALKKRKVAEKSTAVEEDLREKMLSAILTGINRAIPYTSTKDDFFEKHMDTLYRITHSANFNTSIQALMLIQQINGVNQGPQDRFYRVLYESLLDPRLLTSSKQALYLNLLYRALRADLNVNRVKAFVKRLLQVAAIHQPPLVCGVLYLTRELERRFPALTLLIDKPEEDAGDEEEAFHDVDDEDDDKDREKGETSSHPPKPAIASNSNTHKYNARKRDPIHANASTSALWELPIYLYHYHPSISLFASRLLGHETMPPKPNLQQNTLISFLDRFVYKNPKASDGAKAMTKTKGISIMQPLNSVDDGNVLLSATSGIASRAQQQQPVNSDTFWRQEDQDVKANEVFFHKYFQAVRGKEERKREKKEAKKKKNKRGSDDDGSGSDDDDGEEEAIWQALVESRPEIEGDDNDSDVDMDLGDEDEDEDDDADFAAAMEDEDEDDESNLSALDEDGNSDAFPALDEGSSDAELTPSTNTQTTATDSSVQKAARGDKESSRRKFKKKTKGLPTFASAEDYAQVLAEEEESGGE